jgi:hypothetical protein
MTLSAMVAWPTGRNLVRADQFGERCKAFSRCGSQVMPGAPQARHVGASAEINSPTTNAFVACGVARFVHGERTGTRVARLSKKHRGGKNSAAMLWLGPTFKSSAGKGKRSPLFAAFAKEVADGIACETTAKWRGRVQLRQRFASPRSPPAVASSTSSAVALSAAARAAASCSWSACRAARSPISSVIPRSARSRASRADTRAAVSPCTSPRRGADTSAGTWMRARPSFPGMRAQRPRAARRLTASWLTPNRTAASS